MLPLQPPLSADRKQDLADFIAANDLPPDWQPDPEDLSPWWLID